MGNGEGKGEGGWGSGQIGPGEGRTVGAPLEAEPTALHLGPFRDLQYLSTGDCRVTVPRQLPAQIPGVSGRGCPEAHLCLRPAGPLPKCRVWTHPSPFSGL